MSVLFDETLDLPDFWQHFVVHIVGNVSFVEPMGYGLVLLNECIFSAHHYKRVG